MSEQQCVVRTYVDGEMVGEQVCAPDSYVIVVGPDVALHTQVYPGTGTHVLTIKKDRPS